MNLYDLFDFLFMRVGVKFAVIAAIINLYRAYKIDRENGLWQS